LQEAKRGPGETSPDGDIDGVLAAAEARSRARRKAKAVIWTAGAAGVVWGDLNRVWHPSSGSLAATLADGAILHRYGQRFIKARPGRTVADWLAYLGWCVEWWRTIRSRQFGWMVKTPAPETPSIRFFVKFSDRFEQSWFEKAATEAASKLSFREQEIERRTRKGMDRDVAEAEVDKRTGMTETMERTERAAAALKRQILYADVAERERQAVVRRGEAREDLVRRTTRAPGSPGTFPEWE
jgi:hypothetical protein